MNLHELLQICMRCAREKPGIIFNWAYIQILDIRAFEEQKMKMKTFVRHTSFSHRDIFDGFGL